MLKDNHIWSASTTFIIHLIYLVILIPHGCSTGPITVVIARAHEVGGFSLHLDIEVWDEDEANEVIAASADIVMLNSIKGSKLGSVAWHLHECLITFSSYYILCCPH
jgi:nicotinate-nucleotide pyrophosphorylase